MQNHRSEISVQDFSLRTFSSWDSNWFLLTCGDYKKEAYNAMTVAWGGFGSMWSMPMALVVVRPSRFTFINQFETYTLCAFSEQYKLALNILGTKSGKDGDKMGESGLTPVSSKMVDAPVYKEAELAIECKKMYWDDFTPDHFLHPDIAERYPNGDYHRLVIGEILYISGDKSKYTF
jgi:flavin reductase (DIM6/NTAB) family NADH-FMN oxidoreductase RutF